MPIVVSILVDALRHDFVSERWTPFIHSLAAKGHKFRLKPILSYSDGIRATIFTSAYPDRHGYWMSYRYSQHSPFARMKWLSLVDHLPNDFIRRGVRLLLSLTLMRALSKRLGYATLHLHNVPFQLIRKVDMTLRKEMTQPHIFGAYQTIFDVLRSRGISFAYLDSSQLDGKLLPKIDVLNDDIRMVFVYLHYVDEASHWYGIGSPNFLKSLQYVDSLVREIVRKIRAKWNEPPTVILFSDHGMAEAGRYLDLSWLSKVDGFGKDFFFTLDATMVRVWYEREEKRGPIRRLILGACECRLLSEAQRREMGIAFKNRAYGDDIFLLDEGQVLFPNFYSYVKPKAMHAYSPESPAQHGIVILDNDSSEVPSSRDYVSLLDIAPTILDFLGVEIPTTFEGASLVAGNGQSASNGK